MSSLDVALVAITVVFLVGAWRTAHGPGAVDRVLGVELAYAALVAASALLAVRQSEPVLVDVVLVASLVGFLASVGLADLVDQDDA